MFMPPNFIYDLSSSFAICILFFNFLLERCKNIGTGMGKKSFIYFRPSILQCRYSKLRYSDTTAFMGKDIENRSDRPIIIHT